MIRCERHHMFKNDYIDIDLQSLPRDVSPSNPPQTHFNWTYETFLQFHLLLDAK